MNTYEKVYALLAIIPPGKVLTYSQIAKRVGIHPRFVGTILHKNPNPSTIPCYKVVNKKGKLAKSFAFGGLVGQKEKLKNEGIEVVNEKVDLEKYLFDL